MPRDELSLDAVLDVTQLDEGRYRAQIPEGWAQGRGAFGGLVIGTMLRAIAHAEPDPARATRSVTAEIPSPVEVGEAIIELAALRRGAHVSTWRATMQQRGAPVAQLVAVLGATRTVTEGWSARAAPGMSWKDATPVPFIEGVSPEFSRAFEYRVVGDPPFSGGREARVTGWVRPRLPCERRDAAWVAALADAFWPALLARSDRPRPAATVAFTMQLPRTPSLDEAPLWYESTAPALLDGYSVDLRALYTAAGELVALNQQTFAVMR